MYRTKIYFDINGIAENAVPLCSAPVSTPDEANALLTQLSESLGRRMTGGDIETHIPNGIGWVLVDDAESVMVMARMRASDQELG